MRACSPAPMHVGCGQLCACHAYEHAHTHPCTSGVAPNAVTCTAALDLSVHILVGTQPGSHSEDGAKALCLKLIALAQRVPGGGGAHEQQQRVGTLTFALNLVLRALLHPRGQGGSRVAEGRGGEAVVGVVAALLEAGAVPDVITYNTLLLRLLKCHRSLEPPLGLDGGMASKRAGPAMAELLALHSAGTHACMHACVRQRRSFRGRRV